MFTVCLPYDFMHYCHCKFAPVIDCLVWKKVRHRIHEEKAIESEFAHLLPFTANTPPQTKINDHGKQ